VYNLYKMSELDSWLNDNGVENAPAPAPAPAPEPEQNLNPVVPEGEVKPKKPRKKRAPMSAEHKAKCVASLAKAREASKAKRQKNAYVKRIKKKEEEKAKDDIIKAQILADNSNTDKDKEIAKLKKQLESLTLQDVVKKPKPKVEKPLPTIDELNESEPPQQPSKNVEMNIDEVKPVNIPEQTENIKENHTITKEKTSQIVKARRKPRRFKGMAKYGRR
jgi:hypothetical protein